MTEEPGDMLTLGRERAREMLNLSSTSVQSELDHAEGWQKEARMNSTIPMWRIEADAGALGALANAWGRLTLWARANGTYEAVQKDFAVAMDQLTDLRQRLDRGEPGEDEIALLGDVLQSMRHLHERVQGDGASR